MGSSINFLMTAYGAKRPFRRKHHLVTDEECQRRADLSSDRAIKAELLELATQWHWLARQAAQLCERTEAVPPP